MEIQANTEVMLEFIDKAYNTFRKDLFKDLVHESKHDGLPMHHHSILQTRKALNMVTDPVCGIELHEEKWAVGTKYKGEPYHFCTIDCLETFIQDPDEYTESSEYQENLMLADVPSI